MSCDFTNEKEMIACLMPEKIANFDLEKKSEK